MLTPPVRRLLWMLVVLSLIPAGILVTRRIRAEGISERVALVMDAQALTDQAHELGMTPEALPERYRVAITLRLIDELSRDECASQLGVTIGTFDVLLFRAVRAFRKRFGDREPE